MRIINIRNEIILSKIRRKGIDLQIKGGNINLIDPHELEIGDHVRIGNDCFFFCRGGLKIGDNTQISRNVTIYTGNHNIEGEAIPYDDSYILKAVEIGNSVWVGMNVCILPGVKIGAGAIIGMGSVISKDVPEGAIMASNSQRIVKMRNMEKFSNLDSEQRWFGKLWPGR